MKVLMACITLLALLAAGCTPQQQSQQCGIENCHGLNVQCGSNVPRVCTADYRLGDFCRQYAECQTVNNQCQLITDARFEQCKTCVEACEQKVDDNPQEAIDAFRCEEACRKELESRA